MNNSSSFWDFSPFCTRRAHYSRKLQWLLRNYVFLRGWHGSVELLIVCVGINNLIRFALSLPGVNVLMAEPALGVSMDLYCPVIAPRCTTLNVQLYIYRIDGSNKWEILILSVSTPCCRATIDQLICWSRGGGSLGNLRFCGSISAPQVPCGNGASLSSNATKLKNLAEVCLLSASMWASLCTEQNPSIPQRSAPFLRQCGLLY